MGNRSRNDNYDLIQILPIYKLTDIYKKIFWLRIDGWLRQSVLQRLGTDYCVAAANCPEATGYRLLDGCGEMSDSNRGTDYSNYLMAAAKCPAATEVRITRIT